MEFCSSLDMLAGYANLPPTTRRDAGQPHLKDDHSAGRGHLSS